MMLKEFYKKFKGCWIQTADDQKKGRGYLKMARPIEWLKNNSEKAHKMNQEGAAIWIQPNPSTDRKEKNVTAIKWVYVDMDEGTKEEMWKVIESAPIPPTMITESSRSYHLYWRVDATLEQFNQIVWGLIEYFDGDEAISSSNEVLRAPGFYHMKDPDNPFLVRVVKIDDNIHPMPEDMIMAYPFTPKPEEKQKKSTGVVFDVKNIPILDVLAALNVEVSKNLFILDGDEETSASVNVKGNYVNRFSGKDGGGSPIDVVMHYGNKSIREAIEWLKDFGGITDSQNVEEVLREEEVKPVTFERGKVFTWGTERANESIAPLSTEHYTLLTGETGSGKTTFAMFVAIQNAKEGNKVMFLTLEMSKDEMIRRNAREYAGITKAEWRDKSKVPAHKQRDMNKKIEELNNMPNLKIVGAPGASTDLMFEIIKRENPDLVIIDNFDLIGKESEKKEYFEQNRIANELMAFARDDFDGALIVLHHVNSKQNKNKSVFDVSAARGSQKITHNCGLYVHGYRCQRTPTGKDEEPLSAEEKARFTLITSKDRDFGQRSLCVTYFQGGEFKDSFEYNEKPSKEWEKQDYWNI